MPPVPLAPLVTATLNLFPEVIWDRWSGNGTDNVAVYGWIARDDGRSDYVLIMLDEEEPWLISTSSARYSAEFCHRLGFSHHHNCQRVEHDFPDVKSIHLQS